MDRLVIWHRLRRHLVNTRRTTLAGALLVQHWCVTCGHDWERTTL